jgi:hypothetical protein
VGQMSVVGALILDKPISKFENPENLDRFRTCNIFFFNKKTSASQLPESHCHCEWGSLHLELQTEEEP